MFFNLVNYVNLIGYEAPTDKRLLLTIRDVRQKELFRKVYRSIDSIKCSHKSRRERVQSFLNSTRDEIGEMESAEVLPIPESSFGYIKCLPLNLEVNSDIEERLRLEYFRVMREVSSLIESSGLSVIERELLRERLNERDSSFYLHFDSRFDLEESVSRGTGNAILSYYRKLSSEPLCPSVPTEALLRELETLRLLVRLYVEKRDKRVKLISLIALYSLFVFLVSRMSFLSLRELKIEEEDRDSEMEALLINAIKLTFYLKILLLLLITVTLVDYLLT